MNLCEQAVHDGVDILSLSVGPNSPPATTKITYLNPFDATLLSAVKAGVFVAQAAGNGGPFPKTLVSYSPWIATVAAAIDDRRYKNHLTLGNGKILAGLGLSRKFHQIDLLVRYFRFQKNHSCLTYPYLSRLNGTLWLCH